MLITGCGGGTFRGLAESKDNIRRESAGIIGGLDEEDGAGVYVRSTLAVVGWFDGADGAVIELRMTVL